MDKALYLSTFIPLMIHRIMPLLLGDYVIHVKDYYLHVIATNYYQQQICCQLIVISSKYVVNFTFRYHSSYKDLSLYVTSGNAPDLKYTLTVTFTKPPHFNHKKQALPERYVH